MTADVEAELEGLDPAAARAWRRLVAVRHRFEDWAAARADGGPLSAAEVALLDQVAAASNRLAAEIRRLREGR